MYLNDNNIISVEPSFYPNGKKWKASLHYCDSYQHSHKSIDGLPTCFVCLQKTTVCLQTPTVCKQRHFVCSRSTSVCSQKPSICSLKNTVGLQTRAVCSPSASVYYLFSSLNKREMNKNMFLNN